jgi:hypothetical protein
MTVYNSMQILMMRRSRKMLWLMMLPAWCMALAACRREVSPQPARIVSGSMAERFYGEHWQVRCGDCGSAFRCGVEQPPEGMLAICPNCGFRENKVESSAKQVGMAVGVVPRDFAKNPPRRWEVAAFRERDSDRVNVKRVVGLPGERLAIRGGDLFVGEQRVQKSLPEFRELAQLVYDDDFRPQRSPQRLPRWRAASESSRWHLLSDGSGYRCERAEMSSPEIDWLEYHHWSCAATPTPRDADAPIRDNDSYNQGLSRAMNMVGDVAISFRVGQLDNGDELLVRLYGGDKPLVIVLDTKFDEVRILHGERVHDSAPAFLPLASSRDWQFFAGVVDGRVLVEVGGLPTLSLDLKADRIALEPRDVALAIGSHNVFAEVFDLQVFRDVYYLNPLARPGDWQMATPLGEGEFFMLGDNPPLSRDSRQTGSIAVGEIVGEVRPRSE